MLPCATSTLHTVLWHKVLLVWGTHLPPRGSRYDHHFSLKRPNGGNDHKPPPIKLLLHLDGKPVGYHGQHQQFHLLHTQDCVVYVCMKVMLSQARPTHTHTHITTMLVFRASYTCHCGRCEAFLERLINRLVYSCCLGPGGSFGVIRMISY